MPNGKGLRRDKVLTAALVRSVKEPGKYHDGGGSGLFLRVDANGARFWVQRVTFRGKRHEIGLGSPAVVSLAEARTAALENRRLIHSGVDPLAEKRKAREVVTFALAVESCIGARTATFRNEKHKAQWRSTLETYAVPVLARLALNEIGTDAVLRVLEPIWLTKHETASRLRGRIEAVLSWATVAGHRTGENPARWKGNLSELLPKAGKVATPVHQPALALADLPSWWLALAGREGIAAEALRFLAMTASRSGEVRGMTWAEVDLGAGVWTVPAERMKAGREHRVPLTLEAQELLERIPRWNGTNLVFPGQARKTGDTPALSDMTLSAVMRRMQADAEAKAKAAGEDLERAGWRDARSGRPVVPHGLRSSFRDWAAERGIDRDLAEICLAHAVGSDVERAYRRSDMLERRRAVMTDWGRALRGENGTVVDLGRRAK
ncbi:site-specific integrase [Paracoccus sp. PAR01]|uniref:tyrosine-type recombinase/integrase n=1 Tax=Paracoccus sp. PAR01 TaxID=2769282 RepID=UPI00177B523E|nr:site-specific integrase [Paracoccus sp. PAR01]MBD9529845.1 tyrosine-type recombinase/integrase [Paracoccus sp. PAR01]